jgi:predicted CoA-substrate-specific enzyme activase
LITAGVDVGSLDTKVVILSDGRILGQKAITTGDNSAEAAHRAMEEALGQAGLASDNIDFVISTGAGKKEVSLAQGQVSEVMCEAAGARFLYRSVRGVLDLGAESTRAVKLDEKGKVIDFALNDKCAAGTGIFLDAMAKVMGIELDEMGPLSLKATQDVNITSTCVVFAESEVVSQVHRQTPKVDILMGIHKSIASRVFGMVSRVGLGEETMAVGGLARNVGVVTALEQMMKQKLIIPENPHLVPALGAALIAVEKAGER